MIANTSQTKKGIPPFLLISYLGLLGGIMSGIVAHSFDSIVISSAAMLIFGGFSIGKWGPERDMV